MGDLFFGMGIGHSILLFAFVIATGLLLGKFKVKGISIGSTWILFIGILLSHFGFRADSIILQFAKDFGLILFVFSIGLQVGPGFFHSFKKGGLTMNMLAVSMILIAVIVTYSIHLITGESLVTMVGVMSGAVTNTPGLGAAQQALSDGGVATGMTKEIVRASNSTMASAYAVAYPIGVLGVIFLLIFFKAIFKVDIQKERQELEDADKIEGQADSFCCEVNNPAIFGKSIKDVSLSIADEFVISRLCRNGVVEIPGPDSILNENDILLVVTSKQAKESVSLIFGKIVEMSHDSWTNYDNSIYSKRLIITRSSLNGRKLRDLKIRTSFGANITRVNRAGVDLVARPNLIMQVGDSIRVVGPEKAVEKVAEYVGNKTSALNRPNLIPIFYGIVVGVIFGSIPIRFPGIPQPIKLGIAGGPLIIAILLGYFGPRWKITTFTTTSANMMIREMGISLFLAAVGIGAGENFVSSLVNGGYYWIIYGALITFIPILIIGLIGRMLFHLNFYQLCGLISGSTTNPPVLAFSQSMYGSDYSSINYATVYPLSMFMRVLVAQVLILIALA
jgi:putative transport protein